MHIVPMVYHRFITDGISIDINSDIIDVIASPRIVLIFISLFLYVRNLGKKSLLKVTALRNMKLFKVERIVANIPA